MGTRGEKEFTSATIKAAFVRQNGHCASCGIRIWKMGREGAMWHKFGEHAEAHHVKPVLAGGTADADNCVILCRTCHYSAHQGGNWQDVSIYEKPGSSNKARRYVSTETIAAEYPFYKWTRAKERELEQLNE
jgi:HNH endonuclease